MNAKRLCNAALVIMLCLAAMVMLNPVAATGERDSPSIHKGQSRENDHGFGAERSDNYALRDVQRKLNIVLSQLKEIQNGTLQNQARLLDDIRVNVNGLLDQVGGLQLACTTPDLLPIPNAAGEFCWIDPNNSSNLIVRVYNQGGGNAGPTKTGVIFADPTGLGGQIVGPGNTEVDLDTPELAGFGGARNFSFPIPSGCYAVDNICRFKIVVDFPGGVTESNESNNNAVGQCSGTIL